MADDTHDHTEHGLSTEEIARLKGVVEGLGTGKLDGFMFMIGTEKDSKSDGTARPAQGILYSNSCSRAQILDNLLEEMSPIEATLTLYQALERLKSELGKKKDS